MKRQQPLLTGTKECMDLAAELLDTPTVFPDSEGARRGLVLKWYKMAMSYARIGADAEAAMHGALVIMADPSSELCTVDYVADKIEAYEAEHAEQTGGWGAWARSYRRGFVPSLEAMGEEARVNQLRSDL